MVSWNATKLRDMYNDNMKNTIKYVKSIEDNHPEYQQSRFVEIFNDLFIF